jgi:hypothetical protein
MQANAFQLYETCEADLIVTFSPVAIGGRVLNRSEA